jgi:hypothetical protein
MATRLSESRVDHDGEPLPEGVYALVNPHGEIVSYKVRWREQDENGVERQRSKSFSRRELRSLDKARLAAINHRDGVLEIVRAGDAVARSEPAARLTLGELFKEWIPTTPPTTPASGTRRTRSEPGTSTSSRASAA